LHADFFLLSSLATQTNNVAIVRTVSHNLFLSIRTCGSW